MYLESDIFTCLDCFLKINKTFVLWGFQSSGWDPLVYSHASCSLRLHLHLTKVNIQNYNLLLLYYCHFWVCFTMVEQTDTREGRWCSKTADGWTFSEPLFVFSTECRQHLFYICSHVVFVWVAQIITIICIFQNKT